MRRLVASLILVPVFIAPLLLASPAAAATITITDASCSTFRTGSPITGVPGDVIVISAGLTGCRIVEVSKSIVDSRSAVVVTASSGTLTDVPNATKWVIDSGITGQLSSIQVTLGSALGSVASAIKVNETAGPRNTTWTVTIGSDGGGPSTDSPLATIPASIIQQFGKPAVGTCADAATADLNWPGLASGGWGESWAQWMNGGTGGAVCTRTLVYSNAQVRWIVG